MTDEEKQVAYLRKYLEKDKLEEGIALLKKGIPVQYIVGNVDFYGNIIRVDKNVLIPRFETELLVDKTIKRINKYFNNKLIRILELGTGSGCIAISLKKEINSIIDEAFNVVNPKAQSDMGKIMKEISPKLKNRADMGEVNKIIKEKLSQI